MKYLFLLAFALCPIYAQATVVDGWDITVKNVKAHDKFLETRDMETYTGDMVEEKIEYTPNEGHVFATIDITVSKNENDGIFFDASQIQLKTGDKAFTRLEKERDFLPEYQIESFTRLRIKRGKHKGSLLFEIPLKNSNTLKEVYYKGTLLEITK